MQSVLLHCCVLFLPLHLRWRGRASSNLIIIPNRPLDCYALMKPSFCHLFRHFSVTMEPNCALKVAKHLFKNKRYYHHNANDRFGIIYIQHLVVVGLVVGTRHAVSA